MQFKAHKKEVDFELNLVSFIDIMSVLIIFLLTVTVWVQVGVVNVSQAVGETNQTQSANPPSVWVEMKSAGKALVYFKDLKQALPQWNHQQINLTDAETYIHNIQTQFPEVKTALLMPSAKTQYSDVIRVIDLFKKYQIQDVGVSPL